jgi:hypothetical protein
MSLIINSGPKPEDSLPVVDEKAIVHKTSDATANVAIDAEAVSTATTRTITMPDKDIDLGELAVIVKEVTDSTIDPSAGALEVTSTAVALLGTPNAGWDGALEGDIVTFSGSAWEVTEAAGSVEFLFSLSDKGLYGYDATNKWENKGNTLDEGGVSLGNNVEDISATGTIAYAITTGILNITMTGAENVTVNLAASATYTTNITIRRAGAGTGTITIDGNASETIDGSLTNTSALLTAKDAITLRPVTGGFYTVA